MDSNRPSVGLVWFTPSEQDHSLRKLSSDHYLGLSYLAAYLRQRGIQVRQYLIESVEVDDFAEAVARDGVRVLGFSVKDTNFYAVRWAAAAVKNIRPEILTVAGGLTATFSDELLLRRCPELDACVRGYGEASFHALVEPALRGDDWRGAAGVSFLRGSKLVRNPEDASQQPHSLDELPSPYLSGVLPGEAGLQVGVSTSRGCTYRCTFCNPTAMAQYKVRFHSVDRVVAELRHIDDSLARSGASGKGMMLLSEDYFAINPRRTRQICDRLAETPLRHINLGCETRLENLDHDLLSAMYRAGVRFLKFGLESGNPRVLNTIKKVRDQDGAHDDYADERRFLRHALEVIRTARSIGFHVVAGAVFGLPGERLEDAIDTLDFLSRAEIDEYYHNFLQLFPGTEIFHSHRRWGYRLEVREDYYPTIYRTHWPYPVELIPRLPDKLKRAMPRGVLQL